MVVKVVNKRPTDRQKFEENFERIFGKPKEKEKK
jgi:hypothetical protein